MENHFRNDDEDDDNDWYTEKGKEKGDFLLEMHGGKREEDSSRIRTRTNFRTKSALEHNENRYRCRDIIN